MTSGHICGKCGTAMQFDFDGSPRCTKCNGVLAWLRALLSRKPRPAIAREIERPAQ